MKRKEIYIKGKRKPITNIKTCN